MTETASRNGSFTPTPDVSTKLATAVSTTVTDTSDPEDSGLSLLWLPYLILGVVLIGMTVASFMKYHIKNRERYKNRTATIISQGSPFDGAQPERAQKYEVASRPNGIPQQIPLEVIQNHQYYDGSFEYWRAINSRPTKPAHTNKRTPTPSYRSSYGDRSSYQNPAFESRESDGEWYERGRRVTPEGSQAHSVTSQNGLDHVDFGGESRRGHHPPPPAVIKDNHRYDSRYMDDDRRLSTVHNPEIHRSALPPSPDIRRHKGEPRSSHKSSRYQLRDDYSREVDRYHQQTRDEHERPLTHSRISKI